MTRVRRAWAAVLVAPAVAAALLPANAAAFPGITTDAFTAELESMGITSAEDQRQIADVASTECNHFKVYIETEDDAVGFIRYILTEWGSPSAGKAAQIWAAAKRSLCPYMPEDLPFPS